MKRTEIKKIAASYWLHLLMLKTGLSVNKLEDMLMPRLHRHPDGFSNKLRKYKNAKASPNQDFINFVENFSEETSGSKWVFEHPLWKALQCNSLDLNGVHSLMRGLSFPIYNKLFKQTKKHGISERRRLTSCVQIFSIGRESNLDAIAALLLLMRETEIGWKPALYIDTKWEITNLISRLCLDSLFSSIAHKLYDVIYEEFIAKNCKRPVNPSSNPVASS